MNSVDDKVVSVIIPAYNVENYVKQCLDSILNQTYSNLEIIVVDDFSRDNTVSVVRETIKNDNRVKLIELDKHVGVSEARNIGLDNITGEYLYFLDADDFIDPNYLETYIKLFGFIPLLKIKRNY